MELIFATQNINKLKEIQDLLGNTFSLTSLRDEGIMEEVPENQNTIKGNAFEKAMYVYKKTGKSCFADDTGLEVQALNGEPGVNSARYSGSDKNSDNNIDKLLLNLSNINNRNARFVTCIALIINGKDYYFEGIINGQITLERKGDMGFGYDPVFVPDGYNQTFAEMPLQEKNMISHRAIAFKKLEAFLKLKY